MAFVRELMALFAEAMPKVNQDHLLRTMQIKRLHPSVTLLLIMLCILFSGTTSANNAPGDDQDAEAIAKKLADPIADMVTLPFEWNWAQKSGATGQGHAQTLTVQPVIPFNLSSTDAIIFRPIVTAEFQSSVSGNTGYGVRNVQLETFYAPQTGSSWIWGIGPYLSAPIASSGLYGSQQIGGGATGVILNQVGPWTYGLLVYQSWNLGGSAISGTQNNFYGNPFLSYVTDDAWTYYLGTESFYNYDAHRSQTPVIGTISKLVMMGHTPVSYELGARYNLSTVPGGPQGWGARASVTFVLSK